jgi:hypothetical protein
MMTDPLELLENRSYKTYLARLQAAKRLRKREQAWNVFLIALTVATTIAAVSLLANPTIYGPRGDVIMVCVAVLSLAASLIVPSLNYSGRARDMFSNYRRIQRLSSEVERARALGLRPKSKRARAYFDRYQALLDESENQSESDFRAAQRTSPSIGQTQPARPLTWLRRVGDRVPGFLPYVALLLPASLLVPIVGWFLVG